MPSNSKSPVLTDCEFLVRAIQGIVWEADPKTINFTFVSERAEQILGYPAEDWLENQFWTDHLHPEDRDTAIQTCARATSKGLDFEFEYRMIHTDGRTVWLRDTVFVDMVEAEPVRLRGILIDISEQIQMQAVIKESEQLLRLLATSVKDAIFRRRIQPYPHYEYISPAVRDITGWAPEDFYADPDLGLRIIHPGHRGLEATRAFVEPTGEPVTLRIIRKDGLSGWIEMRSVTIYDDAGQPLAIEGIARDITERKELQAKVNQSQRMEALGQLVSGVAYDFNNMLTVVLGYAGLALQTTSSDDPIYEKLEAITRAAKRATLLTRQLRKFSRNQVVSPVVLDLNPVVMQLEGMLRRLVGEQVELTITLGSGLGQIRADAAQIGQVIMNLVVNARDAMPHGGELVIRTSSFSSPHEVRLNEMSLRAGSYTVLTITDNGTGIDPSIQQQMFEPLFTTKAGGSGMGLATVQDIVNQSNGGITFETQLHTGTTFKIFLPVIAEPRLAPIPTFVPARHRIDETIMIVEGDDTVREVTGGVLEAGGYNVFSTKTGAEAIEMYQAHSATIHLVLIDIVLSDMNGQELVERLAEFQRPTKFVFMNGYGEEVPAILNGLDPRTFIQKPFTPTTLLDRVRQLLSSGL